MTPHASPTVDTEAAAGATAQAAPGLELPGLVMRRALVVALSSLVLLVLLGIARARVDTLREMEGSLDLARLNKVLMELRDDDAEAGQRRLRAFQGLRHLSFELRDASGHVQSRIGDEDSDTWLAVRWQAISSSLGLSRPPAAVTYPVPLRDSRTWTVVLTASPDSEVLESASNLVGLVLLMSLCCAAMLAAMHWNVRRALRPMRTLVDAIAGVERHDLQPVRALPTMPVREIESIAQALRHLVAVQEQSEAARRVLAHRLMSLQEDERQRIARDLHDEFGQRLTALRVDASWLQRAMPAEARLHAVLDGMVRQITLIQDDVRQLLARLRPMGVTPAGDDARPESLGRLRSMLQELVSGWDASGREGGVRIELAMSAQDDEWPLAEECALGLYRITQEALTNVIRHAGAARCRVEIRVEGGLPEAATLRWRVSDDGRGIDDAQVAMCRGSGLAGIKDRVWTLGGRFDLGPGLDGRGVSLGAEFQGSADTGR